MKNILHFCSVFILLHLSIFSQAQFPYSESCKNASAPGLVISGFSSLTAGGVDPAGQGYLRLTDNVINNVGYVYGADSFPSNYGITASFEFFSHKPGANSTNQADGMTFFLFDSRVNSFRPGGSGGSLGYAQYYAVPGMAKGYIGIAIDEFGNFSSASDGTKNGGPGQRRNSIAIRGPGDGKSVTDYVYQTGVVASDSGAGFASFAQRYPDSTHANYRRLKIIMTPGSTLGPNVGYKVTVIMYKGGVTVTPVTLINNFDYPFAAPAKLKFGLSSSTGAITNYHEIRNLHIDVANTSVLLAPTTNNDVGTVACQGQQTIIDVTANDVSNNTGGSINKETIDLDPSTPGIQASFIDAGKGTYTANMNGIVSFVPLSGFTGTSTISYKVDDTYGITSATASTITVTINNTTGPDLIISDPAAVCSPSVIDITNPALKTTTTPGSTFSYFNSLSDANNNTNNINSSAITINQSGTYFIRATLSGCATVKPVVVQIGQQPSISNAGSDQTFCSSTGSQGTTLLASNPDIGIGTWTQVSGPSAATITYPNAATSPVSNMAKGVYIFRWTISNTGCASRTDDIQISVGVAANAGSNQTIVNATSATLAANVASPGTGAWSQISGPAATIANTSDPASTISGLTPGNTYVFQWRITNGGCISNSTVTITNVLNTIADAGPDRTIPALLPFSLAGNTPGVGNTGVWTMISGPLGNTALIVSLNSPLSLISLINLPGDYVFRWTISNGAFSNYDEVTIRVGIVLPVTFTSFTGVLQNNVAVLRWQTSSEYNNHHFEIERSSDGQRFQTIGTVAGAGTSSVSQNYKYEDALRNFSSSTPYYRIKQVNVDGKSSYTNTIRLLLHNDNSIMVWPNPFTDKISIELNAGTGNAEIKIFDAAGKMVVQENKYVSGSNLLSIENLDRLGKGVFYLEVVKNQKLYRQTILKN